MKVSRRELIKLASGSVALGLSGLEGCGREQAVREPDLLERLAFGSCNHQDQIQSHWPYILEKKPQVWLWMGDTIYADEALPRVRAKEYYRLLSDANYAAFAKQVYILGTWDDHDYATNDARGDYSFRDESQQVFLDFIGEALDSPRRLQQGIYQSKDIGKVDQAVQMILMDMRYFAEEPSMNADPLGPAQWAFLERELQRPGPHLKILVSSLQCLTTFTDRETWAKFPIAWLRLLDLIALSPAPVVILSGDRHLSELSRFDLGNGSIISEVTSSGLTHFNEKVNENPYRIGDQINKTNFACLQLNWATGGEKRLESLRCTVHSPQDGSLHNQFELPLIWKKPA